MAVLSPRCVRRQECPDDVERQFFDMLHQAPAVLNSSVVLPGTAEQPKKVRAVRSRGFPQMHEARGVHLGFAASTRTIQDRGSVLPRSNTTCIQPITRSR